MSSKLGMPVMAMDKPEERNPYICFSDGQIEKYLPKKFTDLNMGDVVEMTIKAKITGLRKNDEMYKDENGKEKSETRRTVDVEIISASKETMAEAKAKMQEKGGIA